MQIPRSRIHRDSTYVIITNGRIIYRITAGVGKGSQTGGVNRLDSITICVSVGKIGTINVPIQAVVRGRGNGVNQNIPRGCRRF